MSEFINNHSLRKEKLKDALRQIHEGKPTEQVKAVFVDILSQATAGEIAEIEQALIAEGLPVEDIQYLCDVHVAMFRESLDQQMPPDMIPGHPVYTFRAENELANLALNDTKTAVERFKNQPDVETRKNLLESARKLKEYNRHYERKENLLFPYLEKYGFSGPSSVMWGIHDDIRKGWKQMIRTLESDRPDSRELALEMEKLFDPMENAIREMFYKEDRILLPNALERLTDEDWHTLYTQEDEFGFSFATRGADWPEGAVQETKEKDTISQNTEDERTAPMSDFPLTHGDLSISQIDMMLKNLPVDITFVDENDTVRYYSETPERIFKRTPAIIGRKVQNCHPPASVDKVVEIVEDFRAGNRDVAEFWIQLGGKFVHIRYFAMRDAGGNYRGTLEVSQDLTEVRKLEGEKRLLDA
ncbi:MAG TPA: DUF438 domain-containing protein [Pelolinea sp.]|nr:DUF438 domain-containing protein [Pelolinea sp.]